MKKLFVIILSFLTFSCAISKKESTKIDLNKFEFFFIQNGRILNFYFIFNPNYSKIFDTIHIPNIKLNFTSKNLKEKQELLLENVFSGVHQNSETSFQQLNIFYGQFDEMDLNGSNYEDVIVELSTFIKKKKLTRTDNLNKLQLQPNYAKLEFLKLFPKVTEISEDILNFELFAIRVVPHSGEYIPSSEVLRVELYNFNTGKRIISSEGRNFLQVITDVEPRIVGNFTIFSTELNITKKNILERNLIKYIIPAVPNKYEIELNYWKDK